MTHDIEQRMRKRCLPEICDCSLGAHLIAGIEPDEECVEVADEIVKLRAEVERLKQGMSARLSDHINGAPCAAIRWRHEREVLQADIEKLKREVSSSLDLAERHMNEKHKAWEALRKIRDRRNGDRWTEAPDNAVAAFIKLNAELLAIFAECDAALEEPRT